MMHSPNRILRDFAPHGESLAAACREAATCRGARAEALLRQIDRLPDITPSKIVLDGSRVTVGRREDLDTERAARLIEVLHALKPWRKGPFDLFGTQIDSEWDSSLKWDRVAPHIEPLNNRRVLDVGSSNGYYLFRMAAARPRVILGIEPYFAYYAQFLALDKYLALDAVHTLPLKLEALPAMPRWFDTIFCMGVLYHRRSPLDTLARLRSLLANGGELILETLIVEGGGEIALFPQDRYARMRNVYFIPTASCLENWLERCGFTNIRCVDITATTGLEQRRTDWIDSASLEAFLDPEDSRRTVEGYPAPVRAAVLATGK
jgi:tRNA (mo5U34)-methyltransferase